jgi:hypothetical protein
VPSVALVVPSNILSAAVRVPPIETPFGEMPAVVVGAPASATVYGAAFAPASVTAVMTTVLPRPALADWKASVTDAIVTWSAPATPSSVSPLVEPVAAVVPS